MTKDGRPGRIRPGPARGQISAAAWNRAQDAADIVLGQQQRVMADGPMSAPPSYTPILAANNTSGAVQQWGVMSINGLAFTTAGATGQAVQQFVNQPVIAGGLPTGGKAFVVAVEPIAAGYVGRCAVAGVVQAKVNITDASHGYATALGGDMTQLQSAASGEVELLWKEGTGAGKWALVRFGAAGGAASSSRLGKVTGTWTKGATASVQQYSGAGALVTGSTFVAINRAQTVTGPTGGYWVGCDSIDDTWHLAWTECV